MVRCRAQSWHRSCYGSVGRHFFLLFLSLLSFLERLDLDYLCHLFLGGILLYLSLLDTALAGRTIMLSTVTIHDFDAVNARAAHLLRDGKGGGAS